MMPNLRDTLRVTGLFLGLAVALPSSAYERLGEYNVDPSQVSVSGFSSGGVMAAQLGVAYASRIMGVGVFSGWPYDCKRAGGVTENSCEGLETPNTASLEANMRRWSGVENDPVDYVKRQRIYVFVGAHDDFVGPTVVGQTAKLFERFADPGNVRYETTIDAGHTFPTDFDHPLSSSEYVCDKERAPLANCDFDGAGQTLKWIYVPLNPRTPGLPDGSLIPVHQGEFIGRPQGMDDVAFLYVPKARARCAVQAAHLPAWVRDRRKLLPARGHAVPDYSRHSRWAETNNIILLFPQTYPDPDQNPKGGWDERGLYDEHFDQKAGTQTKAIMAMVARITSGFLGGARAIEYHHAGFDHYFVTAEAEEMAKLDNGTFAGWARTGESFAVHPIDTPGASSVCRFFSTAFGAKSSHFYATTPGECATVKANPDWQFEGVRFAIVLPDATGGCGTPGTTPVYRIYNNGQGAAPSHRYTTSVAIRASMMNDGWVPEGEGVGVVGCATQSPDAPSRRRAIQYPEGTRHDDPAVLCCRARTR